MTTTERMELRRKIHIDDIKGSRREMEKVKIEF
jgi:hypothetical protein